MGRSRGGFGTKVHIAVDSLGNPVRLILTGGQVDPSDFIDPHLQPPDPPLHPTAQVQEHIAETIEPEVRKFLGK